MNDLPRIRKESGVFTVEVDRIKPNTMQPRSTFEENSLKELSESIRQYGVLQPLIVVRHEKEVPTGTTVEYELIAGERRWRASKLAKLTQVPVIIREDSSEQIKLELALIENLQREDLGPIERAEAFAQLIDNFKMRHHEVGAKMGKSREFVSNSLRLLGLPNEIKDGLKEKLISEGHTRPLLSLKKQKDEQMNLYKEIIYKKMTVRDAESMARDIVKKYKTPRTRDERVLIDPESVKLQQELSNVLGTKVSVEKRGLAKKISIEFSSENDLASFLSKIGANNSCDESSSCDPDVGAEIVLASCSSCTTCPEEQGTSLTEEPVEVVEKETEVEKSEEIIEETEKTEEVEEVVEKENEDNKRSGFFRIFQ